MTLHTPWRGRLLVLAGIALVAINLRTAITSLTPPLDVVGQSLAFGTRAAGVLGMLAPTKGGRRQLNAACLIPRVSPRPSWHCRTRD